MAKKKKSNGLLMLIAGFLGAFSGLVDIANEYQKK